MSETEKTWTCGGVTSPVDDELPDDLQNALGEFLGTGRIETLKDWVDEIRHRTDDAGEAISNDDLCHVGEETPHRADVDGERYHFRCFYDAVVLSTLIDAPVGIHTETPTGETVEMRADGPEGLEVEPPSAVFSFGIPEVPLEAPDDPTHEEVYGAVCPNVRAFTDRSGYERWADEVDAVTVAAPLRGATELAEALVE